MEGLHLRNGTHAACAGALPVDHPQEVVEFPEGLVDRHRMPADCRGRIGIRKFLGLRFRARSQEKTRRQQKK